MDYDLYDDDDKIEIDNRKFLLCDTCGYEIPEFKLNIRDNEMKVVPTCLNCNIDKDKEREYYSIDEYINQVDKIEAKNMQLKEEFEKDKNFKSKYKDKYCCPNGSKYLYCIKCNKYFCEECKKIHDYLQEIDNYGSKKHIFINREIHFFKLCDTSEHKKLLSSDYCKTCSLYICKKCLDDSNNKHKEHNIIKFSKGMKGFKKQFIFKRDLYPKIDKIIECIDVKYHKTITAAAQSEKIEKEKMISICEKITQNYKINKERNIQIRKFLRKLDTDFKFMINNYIINYLFFLTLENNKQTNDELTNIDFSQKEIDENYLLVYSSDLQTKYCINIEVKSSFYSHSSRHNKINKIITSHDYSLLLSGGLTSIKLWEKPYLKEFGKYTPDKNNYDLQIVDFCLISLKSKCFAVVLNDKRIVFINYYNKTETNEEGGADMEGKENNIELINEGDNSDKEEEKNNTPDSNILDENKDKDKEKVNEENMISTDINKSNSNRVSIDYPDKDRPSLNNQNQERNSLNIQDQERKSLNNLKYAKSSFNFKKSNLKSNLKPNAPTQKIDFKIQYVLNSSDYKNKPPTLSISSYDEGNIFLTCDGYRIYQYVNEDRRFDKDKSKHEEIRIEKYNLMKTYSKIINIDPKIFSFITTENYYCLSISNNLVYTSLKNLKENDFNLLAKGEKFSNIITCISELRDNLVIISKYFNRNVEIFDIETNKLICEFQIDEGENMEEDLDENYFSINNNANGKNEGKNNEQNQQNDDDAGDEEDANFKNDEGNKDKYFPHVTGCCSMLKRYICAVTIDGKVYIWDYDKKHRVMCFHSKNHYALGCKMINEKNLAIISSEEMEIWYISLE